MSRSADSYLNPTWFSIEFIYPKTVELTLLFLRRNKWKKSVKFSLDRKKWKGQDVKCSLDEVKKLQILAGKLNWSGHSEIGAAIYVPSSLQQWTSDLRVRHLTEANSALHDI